MITRPLWRSRSAGSARQRDAWIAFEDSAAGRASAIAPGATADGKDHRWVVSYQRGEIIALVQRVTELELRLQQHSRALAGAMALIALGVAGSARLLGRDVTPGTVRGAIAARRYDFRRAQVRSASRDIRTAESGGAGPRWP